MREPCIVISHGAVKRGIALCTVYSMPPSRFAGAGLRETPYQISRRYPPALNVIANGVNNKLAAPPLLNARPIFKCVLCYIFYYLLFRAVLLFLPCSYFDYKILHYKHLNL